MQTGIRQKVALLNQSMDLHINKDTQLCMSLAGRPGNFGTRFHNFLYCQLGLNFIYKAFTTRDIGSAIAGIRALGIRGCAISMPFKETCIEYLDELDASAKGIMSVNTIVSTDGYLKAYNTDYAAVSELIRLATSLGKKTITGAEVIVLQAIEQFVLYTGVRPDAEQIEKAAAFARS